MAEFSRRKFLATVTLTAGSTLFLKGCLGNSPEPTTAVLTPENTPEVTKAKLGFVPIFEAAPLIIAKEKGFFAKYGMADVEISKQANWGSARDNVEIGSAAGGIDGGAMANARALPDLGRFDHQK